MWLSLLTSHCQSALCTLPFLVVVLISSFDAASKQLLASSFPMLSKTLGLDVETLGYFSLFTNASYALSLPFWGALVHYYGLSKVNILLAVACITWGGATMGIAIFGHSAVGQAVFRALVGAALGSIMPLSQTLLVELTRVEMRGRAFGWMLFCENLAGTLAATSVVYLDIWEIPYYALGAGSVFMGCSAWIILSPSRRSRGMKIVPAVVEGEGSHQYQSVITSDQPNSNIEKQVEEREGPQLTLRQIIHRIVKMPAFVCMVAQGMFGGTPWDMMSFLLQLMNWRGFEKHQIVTIQVTSGLTSTVGGWLGGFLGDYMASHWGTTGRTWLALGSVLGGIPPYGLYLFATDYRWALLWINAFQLWGTWTVAGALRPICADLTRNASERAQIISLWIVLEKMSGALFGAPLVGYLTKNMLSNHQDSTAAEEEADTDTETTTTTENQEGAHALAFNLFILSSFFWFVCAVCWAIMSVVINRTNGESLSISYPDTRRMEQRNAKDESLSDSGLDRPFSCRRRVPSENSGLDKKELELQTWS